MLEVSCSDQASALDLVDTVYLMSIVADRPRPIDRYIDYFGGGDSDGTREIGS